MKRNSFMRLDEGKEKLLNIFGEIESITFRVDEDSILDVVRAVDEIQSCLNDAKEVIKGINKLLK